MANVRWLFEYAKKVKWAILLTTIIFISMNISYIGIISIQQRIIDEIFVAGDYEKLLPIMLLFSSVVIIHVLGHMFGAFAYVSPTKKLNSRISRDLMVFIHKLPIQAFQKERVAKYVHLFSSDIPAVSKFTITHFPSIIADIVSVVFLIYLIGKANITLVFILVIVSAIYGVIAHRFQSQIKNKSKEVQDKKSDHLIIVEEGISSTREVLAFHQIEWEKQRYDKKFASYFSSVMGQGKLINKQLFISDPIKWGIILLTLSFGGYLVIMDQMTLGMFVVLYGFTNRYIKSFHSLFEKLMEIARHLGYVERLRTMMDREQLNEGDLQHDGKINDIEFKGVNFSYAEDLPNVLQDLNFRIPAGKKVAFVGSSGGGKSTIAQLLIRFFEPNNGEICVNGIPLSKINRKYWMKRIDIVFQDPYLFSDSIRMNILLGRSDISEEQLVEVCKALQIDHVFQALPEGYDTEVGERGITLSGGQRQRLAIVRSIIQNPDLLILDEATSALDLETERHVQRNIDEIRKGKTTIIIAHRLSTIKNADIIFVLDNGRVIEKGNHEQLMIDSVVYKKLVQAQVIERDQKLMNHVGV